MKMPGTWVCPWKQYFSTSVKILHLSLVVDVFREHVLVERVAGRAMNEEVAVILVRPRPLGEELPAASRDCRASAGCSSWSRVHKMARSAAG